MLTDFFRIDANLPGFLAISGRPRGGEWLEDELHSWRQSGVDHVISLLMPDEICELDLDAEARICRHEGLKFSNLGIVDRSVPLRDEDAIEFVDAISNEIASGRNVLIHCRQGIGRAAIIAAAVLVENGWTPEGAIRQISKDRGIPVPETQQQREWIERFTPARAAGSSAR